MNVLSRIQLWSKLLRTTALACQLMLIELSRRLECLFQGQDHSNLQVEKKPDRILAAHGLAARWPEHSYGPEAFDNFLRRHYDTTKPGIQKLLHLNHRTGIETRSLIAPFDQPRWQDRNDPPSIQDTDTLFRREGTVLSVDACRSAMKEWGGKPAEITHVVAVTCTNAGSPGFDLDVAIQLGLSADVNRTLLHGVGCAGGLSLVRAAAGIADAATLRGKPANILVLACEITSTTIHLELDEAETRADPSPGTVIFSDGAAAMILCNNIASARATSTSQYDLMDLTTQRVSDSSDLMSFLMTDGGFKLHLSRAVPTKAAEAVGPAYMRLMKNLPLGISTSPSTFDWALHPGGLSIISGVESALGLTKDHLRASREIYRRQGNSSSVAVLAVMDQLRRMGPGRDHVVSCSFGPGLAVEMSIWRRGRRCC